jgi:hypothetical protein
MESYLLSLWERTEVRESTIFRHFLRKWQKKSFEIS